MRSINRVGTLSASIHLRRLRDLHLLEMKGSGNRTYYVSGSKFSAPPEPAATEQSAHQCRPDTHQPQPDTHQLDADTHQLLAGMPQPLCDRLPAQYEQQFLANH